MHKWSSRNGLSPIVSWNFQRLLHRPTADYRLALFPFVSNSNIFSAHRSQNMATFPKHQLCLVAMHTRGLFHQSRRLHPTPPKLGQPPECWFIPCKKFKHKTMFGKFCHSCAQTCYKQQKHGFGCCGSQSNESSLSVICARAFRL